MTEGVAPVGPTTNGETEQLQVAFPASAAFTRIGRVAVVGLALRLGLDVATVEDLRGAVDQAVSALQGPGRISVRASWTPTTLSISFENPDVEVTGHDDLVAELTRVVESASTDPHAVHLSLVTPEP